MNVSSSLSPHRLEFSLVSAECLMVTTSVASLEEGRSLARSLVEARLVACAQILPIESVFRWHDAVETACEHLLLCKIMTLDFALVEAAIRKRHTYDVPEIVAMPIVAGAKTYLDWIVTSTAKPDRSEEASARK